MAKQTRQDGGAARLVARVLFSLGALAIIVFYLGKPAAQKPVANVQTPPLASDLLQVVGEAEGAARATIASELAAWHRRVMQRVDGAFLDWHFSYMRRRGADIKWWWQRLTSGREVAEKTYLTETSKMFHETVMDAGKLRAEMQQIATRAAQRYHTALVAGIQRVRSRSPLPATTFDAALRRVTLIRAPVASSPSLPPVTLASLVHAGDAESPAAQAFQTYIARRLLHAHRPQASRDLQALPGTAVKVATVALLAVKTGTDVTAAAKALGVAEATAGAIGAATAAVVVVAALGAHEWWTHKEYVTTQRPKMRKEIEIALKSFAQEALTQRGHFGKGLLDVSAQIRAAIRRPLVVARL